MDKAAAALNKNSLRFDAAVRMQTLLKVWKDFAARHFWISRTLTRLHPPPPRLVDKLKSTLRNGMQIAPSNGRGSSIYFLHTRLLLPSNPNSAFEPLNFPNQSPESNS